MSEELTNPDQLEEATPEVTPDPTAEKEAALAKREEQLKKFEKDLNKRSTELGITAKELEAARETYMAKQDAAGDDDDFDPAQLDTLKKALKKLGLDPDEVVPVAKSVKVREQEEFAAVGDDFFAAHEDITPEELFGYMSEMGVTPPTSAARFKTVLNRAYKAYVAEKADPDAKATEIAAAKLAELANKDEKVVQVKPKRSGVSDGKRTVDDIVKDPSMGFWAKAELLGD